MIKQSSLLKWAQNGNKNVNNLKVSSKNNWIHPAEALARGHVAYLVKVSFVLFVWRLLLSILLFNLVSRQH